MRSSEKPKSPLRVAALYPGTVIRFRTLGGHEAIGTVQWVDFHNGGVAVKCEDDPPDQALFIGFHQVILEPVNSGAEPH